MFSCKRRRRVSPSVERRMWSASVTAAMAAGAGARLGGVPVFVDSAECCYNLRADQVAAKIGPKTKAIIAVHLFGQCADMDPILAAAKKRNIPVIEDAAQALGAKDKGRMAGTMGTLGCFSFFPTKNLGALGEGGLVTTKDADLAEKIRKLQVDGAKVNLWLIFFGYEMVCSHELVQACCPMAPSPLFFIRPSK